jgi:chorismate mutase
LIYSVAHEWAVCPEKNFSSILPSEMNSSSKPSSGEPNGPSAGAAAVRCRGVRAATTVQNDDRDEILHATRQMLALLIRRNQIDTADIASAVFTVTQDITAEFPALAARQLGWSEVPLLCGYEISVPGSLPRCIRVLLHWNTSKTASEIHHVYLHGAEKLRPDLNKLPKVDFEELEAWINQQMQETE